MLFLDIHNTRVALTLSHPLREVFALTLWLVQRLLAGLRVTYPMAQID